MRNKSDVTVKAAEVEISCIVLVVSPSGKAILINDGGDKNHWIPTSQIKAPDVDDLQKGFEGEITIPEWLAKEKGLI